MRHKTTYAVAAQLVDYDGASGTKALHRKLDGLACHSDSVLNYAELPFAEDCSLRGGHPRLTVDGKDNLLMAVEIDSLRKLSRQELGLLRDDLAGQLSDGIGAGCFDELAGSTGLSVQLSTPLKAKCTQVEGTAWRPRATTARGNEKRIAAVAKQVEKTDSKPVKKKASRSTSAPKRKQEATAAQPKKAPNFKKLFRLLDKVDRNQQFDQIRAELEKQGNDLSSVEDGQLPYGNFTDPKLLRLLLKAGLPAETTDVKGNSLLIQSVVHPKSLELMLKQGVDVNRVCNSSVAATALMRAAQLGKRKAVETLLQNGADPILQDESGDRAIDVVDSFSRDEEAIIALLKG